MAAIHKKNRENRIIPVEYNSLWLLPGCPTEGYEKLPAL
jgi:hypothetical protein